MKKLGMLHYVNLASIKQYLCPSPLGLGVDLGGCQQTLLLSFYGLHASAVILIPGLNGSTKLYSLAVT